MNVSVCDVCWSDRHVVVFANITVIMNDVEKDLCGACFDVAKALYRQDMGKMQLNEKE